jgi:hypothetical protein
MGKTWKTDINCRNIILLHYIELWQIKMPLRKEAMFCLDYNSNPVVVNSQGKIIYPT